MPKIIPEQTIILRISNDIQVNKKKSIWEWEQKESNLVHGILVHRSSRPEFPVDGHGSWDKGYKCK